MKAGKIDNSDGRLGKKLRKDLRNVFNNAGFTLIPQEDIKIEVDGQNSDLDNVFIFENVIVVAEDTTDKDTGKGHLRKKVEFFNHCLKNKGVFVDCLKQNVPAYLNSPANKFSANDIKLLFLYVSSRFINDTYKERYSNIKFVDLKSLSYFLSTTKTIKKSARFEMFKFFGLEFDEIGSPKSSSLKKAYGGLVLPETPSGFPADYKLVSFLIDPETLLKQCYVLRKDGWQDKDCVYQRILVSGKISNMRKYLTTEGRVFVNNVIVTLPDDVKINQFETSTPISEPISAGAVKHPVTIEIPEKSGNIGIIDGQHRVFSYHEGDDEYEKNISKLRNEQHLLVTGIVFPKSISENERVKFEAKLFLEINDKQTRTKAALRQVISAIVDPFNETSIAKMVVNELAKRDPMKDVLEQHYFDKGKLKTTSIVSYGVRHVVKLSGDDSFFTTWDNKDKNDLLKKKDGKLLEEYVDYCASELNNFLVGFKKNIPNGMWTINKRKSMVLTATTVNGLIHCMRKVIENGKLDSLGNYEKAFKKLGDKISFEPNSADYVSSHWKNLGDRIYDICFK
ncbi:DGQHR domain-containing protein [Candidatus Uhrbacteria bacterium]|nr:DGQHR domain-containing protein [Candidatus Uhrbacteria bacterium]